MSGLCQRQACEFAFQAIRHAWSAVVSAPGLTDIFDARWVLSLSPRLGYASWRSYDCIAVSRHFHGLAWIVLPFHDISWVEVDCGAVARHFHGLVWIVAPFHGIFMGWGWIVVPLHGNLCKMVRKMAVLQTGLGVIAWGWWG